MASLLAIWWRHWSIICFWWKKLDSHAVVAKTCCASHFVVPRDLELMRELQSQTFRFHSMNPTNGEGTVEWSYISDSSSSLVVRGKVKKDERKRRCWEGEGRKGRGQGKKDKREDKTRHLRARKGTCTTRKGQLRREEMWKKNVKRPGTKDKRRHEKIG